MRCSVIRIELSLNLQFGFMHGELPHLLKCLSDKQKNRAVLQAVYKILAYYMMILQNSRNPRLQRGICIFDPDGHLIEVRIAGLPATKPLMPELHLYVGSTFRCHSSASANISSQKRFHFSSYSSWLTSIISLGV